MDTMGAVTFYVVFIANEKKLRVSDIIHHHLPHPIGGWDQN